MLGPILCGQLSLALLLPKLRSHFAEFLNNASPVGLRILSSSTCVGLRYGYCTNNSGFSWQPAHALRYFFFAPHHVFPLPGGFSNRTGTPLAPVSPFPARALFLRPHSSVVQQYRNFCLLSIDYASRPRLRSRLTQGRSALPWNLRYSAGRIPTFLSLLIPAFSLLNRPRLLPVPLRPVNNAPLPICIRRSLSFGSVFQPRTFSAQDLSTSELLRTLLMDGCF